MIENYDIFIFIYNLFLTIQEK